MVPISSGTAVAVSQAGEGEAPIKDQKLTNCNEILFRNLVNTLEAGERSKLGCCHKGGIILSTLAKKKSDQYRRVEAKYPVIFLTAEGPIQGETQCITTNTAFVCCSEPLRIYDRATFSIEISQRESLHAEGEVVWSNIHGPDDEVTPRGMIVRFTRLSAQNRARLHKVIKGHYTRKLHAISGKS